VPTSKAFKAILKKVVCVYLPLHPISLKNIERSGMCFPPTVASQSSINKVGGDRHVPTPSLYLHTFKKNLEGLGMFLPFPSTFHDFKDTLKHKGPSYLHPPPFKKINF
jgi:hypothetical protein